MTTLATAAILAVAALGASAAHALTQTINVTASDYQLLFGASSDAPIEPVHLDATFEFDASGDVEATTAGLTIHNFTLPYASSYAYNAAADLLTLATYAGINSCSNPGNSYCGFISNFSTAPNLFFFQQSTADGGYFLAHSVVQGGGDIVASGSPAGAVPEPATWAMMVGGLGLVGAATRRRSATVVAA